MVRSNSKDFAELIISGEELIELKKYTCDMADAFDLDDRIDEYQGERPISFVGEDFDCLFAVIEWALEESNIYPDHCMPNYKALDSLYHRLQTVYRETFPGRSG